MSKVPLSDVKWMKNWNYVESAIVNILVHDLIEMHVSVDEIAIITPFLDQSIHLEKLLVSHQIQSIYTIDKA